MVTAFGFTHASEQKYNDLIVVALLEVLTWSRPSLLGLFVSHGGQTKHLSLLLDDDGDENI